MIKRLRVSNYKSLKDVDVELGPVTVLIGPSGSGKTNFVESLRFLRDFLHHRGEGALQYFGNWPSVAPAAESPPWRMDFSVRFDTPAIDADFEYQLGLWQDTRPYGGQRLNLGQYLGIGFVVREEKLTLADKTLFWHKEGNWAVVPQVTGHPAPGGVVLGSLTGFPEASKAYLALTHGVGWYAFSDHAMRPGEQGPVGGDRQGGVQGLKDNGVNALEALNAIDLNFQTSSHQKEIVAALQRLDLSIASVDVAMPERNSIAVTHMIGGRPLTLQVRQESEGVRRFLACLIALYQSPSKQTLIFEEPEKGIHPGALALLADEFKSCYEAKRGQVLLTTHSPDLLDHFPPEDLRVVAIKDGRTRIGPVEHAQVEAIRENLMRPGELLTFDEARMETAGATPE
jgi:predicted ATPase